MRFVILLLAVFGAATACATAEKKTAGVTIAIDESLLFRSDYADIVYEDGVLSYVSYLMHRDLSGGEKEVPCDTGPERPASYSSGIWIWDVKRVAGKERATVERLSRDKIERVYIQIGNDLTMLAPFAKLASDAGIKVFALDGSPDYIDDYTPLLDRIRRVWGFNQAHHDTKFEGFQIDVEPYLKKDFNIRKEHYVRRYIDMIRELSEAAGDELKLSVALPFWFDGLTYEGRPLAFHVIDWSDEVVIMSYRTDYGEIVQSAQNELCYAATVGKPVSLGLELTRLPDEEHLVVAREDILGHSEVTDKGRFFSKDPRQGLPAVKRYEVIARKLTFFGMKERLPLIMSTVPPFRSFSGYVIHSYEGLYE